MSAVRIDLQHGPCVRWGHEMFEELVGAHMVAQNEEELELLVTYAMDEIHDASLERAVCVLVNAAYVGQAAVLSLLNLATQQRIALEDAGLDIDPGIRDRDPDRFRWERVDTWDGIRRDLNIPLG